ncbi:hypothetical protein K435DRAFT_782761 [Dendrothele bispora CBS 962.96]|uniref:Uncharacterized protein n=1 Tax=Dendrothele bispora (strain CBS 962.96) TaxID=1314807 RepID=A0A4S8LCW9_DENBC|nr:hypothetical protein K435DRAFT_782761 [Dendrothele bispora CBS 962.96]
MPNKPNNLRPPSKEFEEVLKGPQELEAPSEEDEEETEGIFENRRAPLPLKNMSYQYPCFVPLCQL